jgi:methionine-R-sulfoxide reductase
MTARTRWIAFALATHLAAPLALAAQQPAPDAARLPWSRDAKFVMPSDADLRRLLSPLQYDVTQHAATERAFQNEYWNNHEPGIYVDIVSGEPLFSSLDKFDSGTGWPSFTKPLDRGNIKTQAKADYGYEGKEVRSRHANSHLGHVFDDGPKPQGLRYCMNSAAMRFIPASQLAAEGYGEYAKLFEKKNTK